MPLFPKNARLPEKKFFLILDNEYISRPFPPTFPLTTTTCSAPQAIADTSTESSDSTIFGSAELCQSPWPRAPKDPSPHVITIPLSLVNTEKPAPAPTWVMDLKIKKNYFFPATGKRRHENTLSSRPPRRTASTSMTPPPRAPAAPSSPRPR